ncbi:MAG: DUF6850 family outer membrane beta-barrel protein [Bacteroidales bacterium]
MRFKPIIVLLSLSLLFTTVKGQERDYQFLYGQYRDFYSQTPSMLTGWGYRNWSYFGASYSLESGNYRNPQYYNRRSLIDFNTESIYRPDKSRWIFHGRFRYYNGRADSLHNNLSYNIDRYGSPIYLFQRKVGDWDLQDYRFDVTVANNISNRLSLGVKLQYEGLYTFRIVDTRNSQTTLNTELLFSADYKVSAKSRVGLGIGTNRIKTEPALTNKYHYGTSDQIYNIYYNVGMGSYLKGVNWGITYTNNSLVALAQWAYSDSYSSYTLSYKLNSGQEVVVNKYLNRIEEENRVLLYDFMVHSGKFSTMHRAGSRFLLNSLDFNLTQGYSNQWIKESLSYFKVYTSSIIDVDYRGTLYSPKSLFRRVNAHAHYNREQLLDRVYNYRFQHSSLAFGASGELLFKFNSVRTTLSAGATYGKNLNFRNDPGGAIDNLYYNWIGQPKMAFLATDWFEIPSFIRFDIPFKENLVELLLSGAYRKPLKINYPAGASFSLEDKFSSASISLKFYF